MKLYEEHVFEVDTVGFFALLNAESVKGTMGFVICLLTSRYFLTSLAMSYPNFCLVTLVMCLPVIFCHDLFAVFGLAKHERGETYVNRTCLAL
jgi:hypothetical protein